MEKDTHFTEPLIQRIEQYRKTSFEIMKLKAIDKTADVASYVFSRIILLTVFIVFMAFLNIGLALWLGAVLGQAYYGFLALAGFYALVTLILLAARKSLKGGIANIIVRKLID